MRNRFPSLDIFYHLAFWKKSLCTQLSIFCFMAFIASQSIAAAPSITAISPYFGPSQGGETISITGSEFTGATAVLFGSTQASSFTILSDASITAVAPPHTPQCVHITVTNASGTSPSIDADYFVYTGTSWSAYVTNDDAFSAGSGSVSVIDVSNRSLITSLTGWAHPNTVAITPDASAAYVPDYFTNEVSIINTLTNTIASTTTIGVTAGPDPIQIAITSDGKLAYVVCQSDPPDSGLSVINTSSQVMTNHIGASFDPIATNITQDGSFAYLAGYPNGVVTPVNLTSGIPSSDIFLGGYPNSIGISPDQSTLYVTNASANSINVIDRHSETVSTITVNTSTSSSAFTPDGTKVYVGGSTGIFAIRTADQAIIASYPNQGGGSTLVTSDGKTAYVLSGGGIASPGVTVINTADDTATYVEVGSYPLIAALTPDNSQLYIADEIANEVYVLDTATSIITATIPVGLYPSAVAITPDQAPLAKFNATSSGNDPFTYFFDASTSKSPIGTIARYEWNFGDGTQQITSSAQVTHTYKALGYTGLATYSISLTVTNSAGTSTKQIYNYSVVSINACSNCGFVSNNGGSSAKTIQNISVIAPYITSIVPNSGPYLGGIEVTIFGYNFEGVTNVFFGTNAAEIVRWNPDGSITVIAPAGAIGTVNISVVANGKTSPSTPSSIYTYTALTTPYITSIIPNSGPYLGSTEVTIFGYNFEGVTNVFFGTNAAGVIRLNPDGSITAIAPVGAIGTVNISVVANGKTSPSTPSSLYTYTALGTPYITGISPKHGDKKGGTRVEIYGANFTGVTQVLFGTTPATALSINSNTSITAIAPPGSGEVTVSVISSGGSSTATNENRFTYIEKSKKEKRKKNHKKKQKKTKI